MRTRPGAGINAERAAVVLLLVALVYAAIDHGAFFPTGFRVTLLIVIAAALTSLVGVPASGRDLSAPMVALACLAGWYLVSAIVARDVAGAAPDIEFLVGLGAVLVVVRRAARHERALLLYGVLAVGVVVAGTGWAGFVWRRQPLAIPDTCCGGIWRAASTITYANTAAAFLTVCLLVALSLLGTTERPRPLCLITYGLLVGWLATLSRGSWLGLAAGLVVLALLQGREPFLRAWPAVVGALVATAALLPSLRIAQDRHVVLACAGLAAGALVAVLPARADAIVITVIVAAFALTAAVSPTIRQPALDGWRSIDRGRFSTSSPDRSRAVRAALDLARDHPVAGVGPGHVDLTWRSALDPDVEMHLAYAHNEYVQVLAETGGVGFVIVIGGLAATGFAVWKHRRNRDAVAAAGCLAALVALGVHSTTDFLWHVPIVPLTGAILVGILLPGVDAETKAEPGISPLSQQDGH